jgi:hypothetical protein
MESRFDLLAKALASEVSRREALRRLGGTAAGALLTSLGLGCKDDVVGPMRLTGSTTGPRLAQGGNSDCAQFCNELFPPGRERGECKSAAAHGEGLCPACGGDVTRVCVTDDVDMICCNPGELCCPAANTCCDTAAGETCCPTANQCCGPGEACCGTTCCTADRVCDAVAGACVCPPGTEDCGGSCCPAGSCCAGVCCGAAEICFEEICRTPCPPNTEVCGATLCCLPGFRCQGGMCVSACTLPAVPCPVTGTCCTLPRICTPTGQCVCPPLTASCGALCCLPGTVCVGGNQCLPPCPPLTSRCGTAVLCCPTGLACCPAPIVGRRCCPPLARCGGPTGCCFPGPFGICVPA